MTQILLFTCIESGGFFRSIGAYQIANVLRKYGYTVQVIDWLSTITENGNVLFLQILKKYVNEETLWIGFSTTFFFKKANLNKNKTNRIDENYNNNIFDREQILEIKEFVYSISPKCRFVLGGGRAYIEDTSSLIDTYILGYADQAVIEFTKFCQNKNPFFQYKKINESIIVDYDTKGTTFNFSESEFTWHHSDHIYHNEALPIEISRGCIFNCSYCSYPLNGKKKLDYIKEPNLLVDLFLSNYEKFNTTNYVYLDDTHNDSTDKLEMLYNKVYSKLPFKIKFCTYLRLDLLYAHPEMIDLLKESGLISCFFGIESLNYESNKIIGKGIKQEKIIYTLETIKNKWGDNVRTEGGFIIGLPNDSKESLQSWISILEKENLLHSYRFHSLGINKSFTRKPWSSKFDQNPEKYGYKMIENNHWINNVGMTSFQAYEIYIELEKRLGNKLPWTGVLDFHNLGASFDECLLSDRKDMYKKYAPSKTQIYNEYLRKILSNK